MYSHIYIAFISWSVQGRTRSTQRVCLYVKGAMAITSTHALGQICHSHLQVNRLLAQETKPVFLCKNLLQWLCLHVLYCWWLVSVNECAMYMCMGMWRETTDQSYFIIIVYLVSLLFQRGRSGYLPHITAAINQ